MILRVFRGGEILNDFELDEGEYLIGRGDSSHIRIESEFIAPEHVRLRVRGGAVEVENLGNGCETWVGESALLGVQPLPKDSIVQLGDVAFQILNGASPAVYAGQDEVSGRYVVGAVVASGAMGVIRSARELHTGREVAMKQMQPGIDDSALVTRFVQEAKITAHLEHPNVVPVHDVSPGAGAARFYTMKMVRGDSLEALLEKLTTSSVETAKAYPIEVLLTIFQKVCDAVAFAHSKGIIHRDLKPANIMVGAYGEVLVMDWGLAKVVGDSAEISVSRLDLSDAASGATLAGTLMGTPHYMSPEQATGETAFMDERSDVYALGAILYQILTLQTPIEGTSAGEVLQKVRDGKIVPPQERRGAKMLAHLTGGRIPASLAAVAMKALTFSPERRYQRVTELQADIRSYQSGFATGAEGAGAWRQAALLVRRHKAVFAIGVAAIAVVIALVAGFVARLSDEKDRLDAEKNRAREGERQARLHAEIAKTAQLDAENQKGIAESNAAEAQRRKIDADNQRTVAQAKGEELALANEKLGKTNEKLDETNRTLGKTNEELGKTNEELALQIGKTKTAEIAAKVARETAVTKRLEKLVPDTETAAQRGDFGTVLTNSVFLLAGLEDQAGNTDKNIQAMAAVHRRRIRAALAQMPRLLLAYEGPTLARISPDASRVVFFQGGKGTPSGRGTLYGTEDLFGTGLLNPKGTPIEYQAALGVDGAEFSLNSKFLFAAFQTAPGQSTVRLWDAREGQRAPKSPPNPTIPGILERFLPFAHRTTAGTESKVVTVHAIAGSQRKEIRLWDLDGNALSASSGQVGRISGVVWSLLPPPRAKNSFFLQSIGKGVTLVEEGAHKLEVGDKLLQPVPVKEPPLHLATAISPNGARVVQLVSGRLGLSEMTPPGVGGKASGPLALTVSGGTPPRGVFLRTQTGERQQLIKIEDGKVTGPVGTEMTGGESVFSPDSRWLLMAAGEKAVLHDAENNLPALQTAFNLPARASRLAFSGNSNCAVVSTEENTDNLASPGDKEPVFNLRGASVSLWSTKNGLKVCPDILFRTEPRDFSTSADGRFLLATGEYVSLWDTAPVQGGANPNVLAQIHQKHGESTIWVSRDGTRAVVIEKPVGASPFIPGGKVNSYDLTKNPIDNLGHPYPVPLGTDGCCWLTGNGRFLVVWGGGRGTSTWELATGRPATVFAATSERDWKDEFRRFYKGNGVVVVESATDSTLGLVIEGARHDPRAKERTTVIFSAENGDRLTGPGSLTGSIAVEGGILRVPDLDGKATIAAVAKTLKREKSFHPDARRAFYSDDRKLVAVLCTNAAEPTVPGTMLSSLVFDANLVGKTPEELQKPDVRDYRLKPLPARAWRLHVYDVETGNCLLGEVLLPALVAFRWKGESCLALSNDGKWTEIDVSPDKHSPDERRNMAKLLTGRMVDKATGTIRRSDLSASEAVAAWSQLRRDHGLDWQAGKSRNAPPAGR